MQAEVQRCLMSCACYGACGPGAGGASDVVQDRTVEGQLPAPERWPEKRDMMSCGLQRREMSRTGICTSGVTDALARSAERQAERTAGRPQHQPL